MRSSEFFQILLKVKLHDSLLACLTDAFKISWSVKAICVLVTVVQIQIALIRVMANPILRQVLKFL